MSRPATKQGAAFAPSRASDDGAARRAGVQGLVRRVVRREWIDGAFDWVRFKIDTLGAADYQPIADPERDRRADRRIEGTSSRWESIAPLVQSVGVRTAVDIGCNVGWFSLSLAELGVMSVGVEGHPPLYRTANYLAGKRSDGRMAVLAMTVTPETVSLVPSADCVLFLAVWHHIVRRQGQEAADFVLGQLWRGTKRILFFETGESAEMPALYRLPPMDPSAESWIAEHLTRLCPGGEVRHLGLHPSSPSYARNLFAVIRSG